PVNFGLRSIAAVYGTGEVGRFVDDPGETLLDPVQARDQVTDSLFGANETAFLHLDDAARESNAIAPRLLNPVPANFRDDLNAAERRRRYTTVSADLKSYSISPDRMRPWETRQDLAATHARRGVFPPYFGPPGGGTLIDPFRSEARGLLQQETP